MSQTLKSRIAVIILMTLLLSLISTICCAAEATETIKAKLNTKIYFEGDTHLFHSGRLAKRVRKSYKDGKLGCGIVSIICENKEYGVYVTGEGWISESQIRTAEKYITLKFDKVENGLNSSLTINGEFVNVVSDNSGIIKFENGVLTAGANGTTTVKITTKEGKEIEALATVYDGNMELNIPEKSASLEGNITADIADKKLNITADGDAKASLKIENGSIGIEAEGNGNVTASVEGKEILDVNGHVDGSATVSKEGFSAEAKANQTMTILQKLSIQLNERANAYVDKEKAGASAGADASVDDKQVASADAGIEYKYGETDPTADLNVKLLEKDVVNVEDKTVPVISSLKALLAKIK